MPGWAEEDPHAYWEAADAHERANGRLFREVEFALPTELDEGERRELALEFAQSLTAGERLPYTLAIHRGRGENPHCHLVISERSNDGLERTAETVVQAVQREGPGAGRGAEGLDLLKGVARTARGRRGPSMRTGPWREPGAGSGSTTGACPIGRRKRGRRETWSGRRSSAGSRGSTWGPERRSRRSSRWESGRSDPQR